MNRKYDGPLSSFAFNRNLRHYMVAEIKDQKDVVLMIDEVGRCRLTPG